MLNGLEDVTCLKGTIKMGNVWNEIENYISDGQSICREERQYALYLANVLRRFPNKNALRDYLSKKDKSSNEEKKSDSSKKQDAKNTKNIEEQIEEHWLSTYHIDDYQVADVFYEATFMRDCFTREREQNQETNANQNERKSFNELLIEFVAEEVLEEVLKAVLSDRMKRDFGWGDFEWNDIKSMACDGLHNTIASQLRYWHLGANVSISTWETQTASQIEEIEKNELRHLDLEVRKMRKEQLELCFALAGYIARCMMNAKPDLAIWYKHNSVDNKYALCFVECKFESGEGDYEFEFTFGTDEGRSTADSNHVKYVLRQTMVQKWILKFLQKKVYGSKQLDILYFDEKLISKDENKIPKDEKIISKKIPKYVKFSRQSNLKKYYDERTKSLRIPIAQLIEMNQSIFENR